MDHCPRVSVFLNYNLIRFQMSDFRFQFCASVQHFYSEKKPHQGETEAHKIHNLIQHGFFFFFFVFTSLGDR